MNESLVETDVLVVGGGIAGCFAAIEARKHGLDVVLVDKAYAGKSGASGFAPSAWMVFNPEWGLDFDNCMEALNFHGEYINNREWCELVLKESLQVYRDLLTFGVKFSPEYLKYVKRWPPFGNICQGYRNVSPVLRRQVEKVNAKVVDRVMIVDLLVCGENIVGAVGFSIDDGDFYIFKAKATVLSAGGNSFKRVAFPIAELSGDADAMAYRAGAEITGKEFCCTTHPTIASRPAAFFPDKRSGVVPFLPYFTDGEDKKHPAFPRGPSEPDLTFDFAIHAGKGPLFWDFGDADPKDIKDLRMDHRNMYGVSRDDELVGKIRMVGGTAVGYANIGTGGVWATDTKCSTTLEGLYVAGDCAGTRVYGSYIFNPGGGTCHAAVTGRRAGAGAVEYALRVGGPELDVEGLDGLKEAVYSPLRRKCGFDPRWVIQLLQGIMVPYYILYIKHERRLQAALTLVEFLRDHFVPKLYARDPHELRLAHETRNMVLNAEMILRASLFRTESRGVHYREDYPRRRDPEWLAWTKIKEENGEMKLYKEPVPKEWWPDLTKPEEERYPFIFPKF